MFRVVHTLPYLPSLSSGGPVRDYNVIKLLKMFNIDSKLICNNTLSYSNNYVSKLERDIECKIFITDVNPTTFLKRARLLINFPMYPPLYEYDTEMHRSCIVNMLKKYYPHIVHAQHIVEASPTLRAAEKTGYRGYKVITMHNVDYLNVKRTGALQTNLIKKYAFYNASWGLKPYELRILQKFDLIFTVSEHDRKIYISEGIPPEKVEVIPNGVDTDYFDPAKVPEDPGMDHPSILFMGLLSYKPNMVAISEYLNLVHPLIKKHIPNVKLYIIGKNCPKWLYEYAMKDDSVCCVGFVEDVRPYIKSADICIAPLTSGSGTRLKILEYMALGKPIVSTSIGAEGLDIEDGQNIIIEDNWSDFAAHIVGLIKDPSLSYRIGQDGRELVKRKYDWKSIVEKQANMYHSIIENGG